MDLPQVPQLRTVAPYLTFEELKQYDLFGLFQKEIVAPYLTF